MFAQKRWKNIVRIFVIIMIAFLSVQGCGKGITKKDCPNPIILAPTMQKIPLPKGRLDGVGGRIKPTDRMTPGTKKITISRPGGYYFSHNAYQNLLWRDNVLDHYRKLLEKQIETHNKAVDKWNATRAKILKKNL